MGLVASLVVWCTRGGIPRSKGNFWKVVRMVLGLGWFGWFVPCLETVVG